MAPCVGKCLALLAVGIPALFFCWQSSRERSEKEHSGVRELGVTQQLAMASPTPPHRHLEEFLGEKQDLHTSENATFL